MKMLIGLLSFALSFASIASSGETRTFTYDGSQDSVELLLRGEKTHTEYRYEQVRTTCYRQEIVGWRTVCPTGPRPTGPRPGPRPTPRPNPGQCTRTPIYRTVAYSCIETVRVPYEVKDYDVDARVLLDVAPLKTALTPGETFKVTLHGDNLSISAHGSKKFFIMLKKQDVRSNIQGSVKYMDAFYSVELIESASILKALSVNSITFKKPVLHFNLGQVESFKHIGLSLDVTRKRTLASDIELFDRELDLTEVSVNGSNVAVDLSQLGIDLSDKKYAFTARAFFKAAGSLLNKDQFGDALNVSRTLVYKQ